MTQQLFKYYLQFIYPVLWNITTVVSTVAFTYLKVKFAKCLGLLPEFEFTPLWGSIIPERKSQKTQIWWKYSHSHEKMTIPFLDRKGKGRGHAGRLNFWNRYCMGQTLKSPLGLGCSEWNGSQMGPTRIDPENFVIQIFVSVIVCSAQNNTQTQTNGIGCIVFYVVEGDKPTPHNQSVSCTRRRSGSKKCERPL